jgi:hypothetical protein
VALLKAEDVKDMPDQYYGPGVDVLRNKLRELKESKK